MHDHRAKVINLVGLIDQLSAFSVDGWAFERQQPGLAVELALWIDGAVAKRFRPQIFWSPLAGYLGLSTETLGPVRFSVSLPEWVRDGLIHTVDVRCAYTGKALPAEQPSQVQFINPHLPIAQLPPPWLATTVFAKSTTKVKPQITVVVLNRNGAEVLSALLRSWANHNRAILTEWVVIDHASSDHSLDILNEWSHRMPMRVKALKVNQSFSASCNLGARLARTPNLLFLNNDLVWQHDALPGMLDTLNRVDVCAVGMKLLKVVPGAHGEEATEVQHLGVRFVQHADGYGPYEITPDDRELEYAPQQVPAVTGAALLCRASDFWATGGFDESYFYGFEDVEFCMRLHAHTSKSIVCRNDLVALHRHGFTRLTGREQSVLRHLWHNGNVLNRHIGLWLKCHWWHDVVHGLGNLSTETLTIGVMVPELPPPYGMANELSLRLADMVRLAKRMQTRWPTARILLVHPGRDVHWVYGLHVLVVTDPSTRRNALKQARPDLRCIAWVGSEPERWVSNPDWLAWDARLAANANTHGKLKDLTSVAVEKGWVQHMPLGARALPLGGQPVSAWRAMVCWPRGSQQWANEAASNAKTLLRAWLAVGVPCHVRGAVQAVQPDQADTDTVPIQSWVAEVVVWLLPANYRARHLPLPRLGGDCLNLVWWCSGVNASAATLMPDTWPADESGYVVLPDIEVVDCPCSAQVHSTLEDRVGRTFSAS